MKSSGSSHAACPAHPPTAPPCFQPYLPMCAPPTSLPSCCACSLAHPRRSLVVTASGPRLFIERIPYWNGASDVEASDFPSVQVGMLPRLPGAEMKQGQPHRSEWQFQGLPLSSAGQLTVSTWLSNSVIPSVN